MTDAAEFGLNIDGELIDNLRNPANAPGYTEARILAVLQENGYSQDEISAMSEYDLSAIVAALYADNQLFEEGDKASALRSPLGVARQVSDDDEMPSEAGKVQEPEIEPDNSRLGEAVVAAMAGTGIAFLGEASSDDTLNPECTDGFEMPPVLKPNQPSLADLMSFYKRKSTSSK